MKVHHRFQIPVTRDVLQCHFNSERWPAFERSFDAIDKELELTDFPLYTSRTGSFESLLLVEDDTHTGRKRVKFSYDITELQKAQPRDYETPRFTNKCKTMCWLNATMQVTPSLFSHTFSHSLSLSLSHSLSLSLSLSLFLTHTHTYTYFDVLSINTLPAFPHSCCSILAHLLKR